MAIAHLEPSTTWTNSGATSTKPTVAGKVTSASASVSNRRYFRSPALSDWSVEKKAGVTLATRLVIFSIGALARVRAMVYRPRGAAPRTRPAIVRSAFAVANHAMRVASTCHPNAATDPRAAMRGQANGCERRKSVATVEYRVPAISEMTSAQYPKPSQASRRVDAARKTAWV